MAAIDNSPAAALVTETAARLAADGGRAVHVVHAQEGVTAGDGGTDGEAVDVARAVVRDHLAGPAELHGARWRARNAKDRGSCAVKNEPS